jgi:hypothetical protein
MPELLAASKLRLVVEMLTVDDRLRGLPVSLSKSGVSVRWAVSASERLGAEVPAGALLSMSKSPASALRLLRLLLSFLFSSL